MNSPQAQNPHDRFMHRCLQLALLGRGNVEPNPMVGAVLVYNGRIIGEGYHEKFGEAHAEINCINSVAAHEEHLIAESTLYVSLEPCNHHGKTPPCCDLILQKRIPRTVIATADPFGPVNGSGISRLKQAGVAVQTGVIEKAARRLNRFFFTYVQKRRPYIILKWAQSADNKIAGENGVQKKISNEFTDRLVHKWRAEVQAVMVGTNTALNDDPLLTTRLWKGNQPLRVVVDNALKLPASLNLFHGSHPTLVMNLLKNESGNSLTFCRYSDADGLLQSLLQVLYERGHLSLLVEGGAKLLQSFITAGLWDEARVIKSRDLFLPDGLTAPVLSGAELISHENVFSDGISFYRPV